MCACVGGRGSEILLMGDFFTGWREPKEWFWQFEPFSKLKTAFCEYRTSIRIKINMTYVCPKSMKLKQDGARAITTAEKAVFIGLELENWCLVGAN